MDKQTLTVDCVTALFVDACGVYPTMVSDCYDIQRDARTYTGDGPVIAHPPCQRWGSFAALNYKRYGGDHNRPGADGGLFEFALHTVRRCGGILEHPAHSKAWQKYGLQEPRQIGWSRINDHEWVSEVWQSAYGHKARKKTWLLYHSPISAPPIELRWQRMPGTHQVGYHDQRGKSRNKPTLTRKEAAATPPAFAYDLMCCAVFSRYEKV